MNKKGFILSTYVYILLTFFLLILGTTLVVLNNTKMLAKKIKDESIQSSGMDAKFSLILQGDKEIELFVNEEFTDPGYIAQTTKGEVLEAVVNSNVDTSNAGDYVVIYTVTYNGETKSITRNVKVIEPESIFLLNAKLIAEKAKLKYMELGNASNITCESVEVLDVEDYQECSIIFDEDIAKVSIIGKGKFAGLEVCDATKEEASIDNGHSVCKLNGAYQEVEYIESTGTQWIDTGYYSTPKTDTIELNYQFTEIMNGMILGVNNTNRPYEWWYNYNSSQAFNIYIQNMDSVQTYIKIYEPRDLDRHIVKREKMKVYHNKLYIEKFNESYLPDIYTKTITLFSSNGDYKSKAKIFYCKIYDFNDVLVRDYIPVYRKSDNVIGLYDLVNDVFYTNAGTGTFLKGNNIVR